jgi:hypothetical protein
MVLSNLSYVCVVVSQVSISAGRGCFFTLGALCSIGRPVFNAGFALMVASQWFCCDDLAHRFSPLLSQSDERGVLWDHALN